MSFIGQFAARQLRPLLQAIVAGYNRLDKSFNPNDTIAKVRRHRFTWKDSIYIFHAFLCAFWVSLIPGFPLNLAIPFLYLTAILIPFTSQLLFPAMPVLAWVLTFFSSRFIPVAWRPPISVALLPTLESVLYGANISDILTRFTHPLLDIMAWLPYGVCHFSFPFVVAIFTWLFRTTEALQLWARAFGYMNLIGVATQIIVPCAAPWYELIYGLTPANYSMKGSPGGLARIDRLLHSNGYTTTFSNAPVVFGAFPSLHAGSATMTALFVSHFFPRLTKYIWAYTGVLYWATMYLTHHYLIDVVAGACLSTACFYLYLPDELKGVGASAGPGPLASALNNGRVNKYEQYGLERNGDGSAGEFELSSEDEEEVDIAGAYRSPTTASFAEQSSGRGHRHTASIASLIRGSERGAEEAWGAR